MRGAWIEILKRIIVRSEDNGRSPCGERGLKYFPIFEVAMCPRRSPCGERGLKYPPTAIPGMASSVAPRAGSVD